MINKCYFIIIIINKKNQVIDEKKDFTKLKFNNLLNIDVIFELNNWSFI
jgi:hypothetical protein